MTDHEDTADVVYAESEKEPSIMSTSIITEATLSDYVVRSRDTEVGHDSSPWSPPYHLAVERDGDGRPTTPNLSAALIAAAGLLDQQTTSVTISLDVTDGGALIRTVEYEVSRA